MDYWVIQSSDIQRDPSIPDKLKAESVDFVDFGVIPFTNEVTNHHAFDLNRQPFVYCGVKLLRLFNQRVDPRSMFIDAANAQEIHDWMRSGVFYDKRLFDQFVGLVSRHLMVNGDCDYSTLGTIIDVVMESDRFIKPSDDLKPFRGFLVPKGHTLREVVEDKGQVDVIFQYSMNAMCIVAPPVEIDREWRLFFVGGRFVSGSQYFVNGTLAIRPGVPAAVTLFAETALGAIDIPVPHFVVDVCQLKSGGFAIVEFNCINGSGFYGADVGAIARALGDNMIPLQS